jgi:hypothetical protein
MKTSAIFCWELFAEKTREIIFLSGISTDSDKNGRVILGETPSTVLDFEIYLSRVFTNPN